MVVTSTTASTINLKLINHSRWGSLLTASDCGLAIVQATKSLVAFLINSYKNVIKIFKPQNRFWLPSLLPRSMGW